MKIAHWVAAAAAGLLSLFAAEIAVAGTFHERVMPAGSHPESRDRRFQVYVPDGLPADGSAPLVTVLHGCRQTERSMIDDTRFTELADAHGFAVAFPFVTSFRELRFENCWGFFLRQHRIEGSGEVADLRRIIGAVEREFATDPARRYVAGLSSGAGMAVAVAVAYSEDIAAAGAVAGLPYGEGAPAVTFVCGVRAQPIGVAASVAAMEAEQATEEERRLVPLMAIHSLNDCTVQIEVGRNLRDAWILHHGAGAEPITEADCTVRGVACRHAGYADAEGRSVVETVFYTGPTGSGTHFWPGDNAGRFANPAGPSASEHLWEFFRDKTLDGGALVRIAVTAVEIDGDRVSLEGTATAAAGVTAVAVALDGAEPQAERPAALAGDDWSVEFEAVPVDADYTPVVTATLGDGRAVTRRGARFTVGEPVRVIEVHGTLHEHLVANRLRLPPAGCPNRIFGACDRDIASLVIEHGVAPFPLYGRDAGGDWFARRENVRP